MEVTRPVHRLYQLLSILDVSAKLQETYEFIVDPYQVTKSGFLAEFYMGTVLNKESGETTHIIIKTVPGHGIVMNFNCDERFRNELHLYSKVFPKLKKFQKHKGVRKPFRNVARYMDGLLVENKDFLIMENLKAAGYRHLDKKQYVDSNHLAFIFQTYGRFHALSFVYKHQNAEDYQNLTNQLVDIMTSTINRGWMRFLETSYFAAIDNFDPEIDVDVLDRLKNIESVEESVKRKYVGNYSCLTHGASGLSNMLFKYTESGELQDMKLIDFQFAYTGTPIYDLSYFFYSAAAEEDLNKLDYYLDIYYKSFTSFVTELGGNPEKLYPFEVLKQEWKTYSLSSVLIALGMLARNKVNEATVISLASKNEVSPEKCFEMWNDQLSEITRGETFKKQARDLCLHAVKYGIL